MDAIGRPSQQLINAQKELARRRELAGVRAPLSSCQPPAAAELLAVAGSRLPVSSDRTPVSSTRSEPGHDQRPIPNSKFSIPNSQFSIPSSELPIRLSPTLAGYCLDRDQRHNDAALDGPYRLYKILQALDENGRGWLANSDVEPLLSRKGSPCFLYGRRQLKIMLRRGEGLFWQRVKRRGQVRIRLVARAKVVERLGIGRLRGREVELPLSYLLGSGRGRQAQINAALYAAVLAGHLRPDRGRRQEEKPRPVSRATLRAIAGCSAYRQRAYEKSMHIKVQRNIHILGAFSAYAMGRAREHGGLAAYKHIDYQGRINRHKRGAAYIAVRLPNSYQAPDAFTVIHSQRQRTINRSLDGLCPMGSGGSGSERIVRLYHRDVAAAVRAAQRNEDRPTYWPLIGAGPTRLWQELRLNRAADERPFNGGDLN